MRQGWNDVWARNSTSLIWKIFYAEGNNSWKINGTALQRLPLKDYTDKRVNKQHKQEIIVAWRGGEGGEGRLKKDKDLKKLLRTEHDWMSHCYLSNFDFIPRDLVYLRLMPSLETSLFIEMTGVLRGKAVWVGMCFKKKKKGKKMEKEKKERQGCFRERYYDWQRAGT